ncbi:type II secretion system F family protein [Methanocaldococcus sp.]
MDYETLLKVLHYHLIKKNVIIFRKLGRKMDERKFIVYLIFLILVAIVYSRILNLSLKGTFLAILVYLGFAFSLPSILYENKIESLEKNLSKALYIMVLVLESGRSINEALHEVVKANIKEVSDIFSKVIYLIENRRVSFEDALRIVSVLYDSSIFRMLAKIMIENRRYGGNLAESLKKFAETLENFTLYRRQLLSVVASGLAMGIVILCLVVPGVVGMLGAYFIVIQNMIGPEITKMPPTKPEDISKALETIQLGSLIIGCLFSVPVFGFKLKRMFMVGAIVMTISTMVFWLAIKFAPSLFST